MKMLGLPDNNFPTNRARHHPRSPMAGDILYVGCRTTKERKARGRGLGVFERDPKIGWKQVQLVEGLENPSYLAISPARTHLYAIHGDMQEVSSLSVNPANGRLSLLGTTDTGGLNPVHLCVDPSGRFVLVANHLTSTIALLPIAQDGTLKPVCHLHRLEGELGPHRREQSCLKPHQVTFDSTGRFIFVPDKGADGIHVLMLDADAGLLLRPQAPFTYIREGAGPRHMAVSTNGKKAWILNELDSSIAALDVDPGTGRMNPFQILPSLPDRFVGNNRAADICISADGRHLYVSNRGDNSIGAFHIDAETGRMEPLGWWPSHGATPRAIHICEDRNELLVANEGTDTVAIFQRDPQSGALNLLSSIATGSPVSLLML